MHRSKSVSVQFKACFVESSKLVEHSVTRQDNDFSLIAVVIAINQTDMIMDVGLITSGFIVAEASCSRLCTGQNLWSIIRLAGQRIFPYCSVRRH